MIQFDFATAQRLVFGAGVLKQSGKIAAEFGRRVFVVTGGNAERAEPLLALLQQAGCKTEVFSLAGEPTIEQVQCALKQSRKFGSEAIIGFGGGSVIDTGKAIAALMTNHGEIMDYLEIIGKGKPIIQTPLPFIAIPTTAGTGAEVTRNAVLSAPEHGLKVSLRGVLMLPRVALVDPELTYDLPPSLTASTGLDALTQLIEAYVSPQANLLTDMFCREGLQRASRSLRRAYDSARDPEAREDMALASLYGGLALANAKLGAVHGLASPIGGMYAAPHGAVCARLLPVVVHVNVRTLKARGVPSEALRRYDEIAQLLTGYANASAPDSVVWLGGLCREFQIPPLAEYGLVESDYDQIANKASRSSSMQGNPVVLNAPLLREVLEKAS